MLQIEIFFKRNFKNLRGTKQPITQRYECLKATSTRIEVKEVDGVKKMKKSTEKRLIEFQTQNQSRWCSFCLAVDAKLEFRSRIGHKLYQKVPTNGKCPICKNPVHFLCFICRTTGHVNNRTQHFNSICFGFRV